MNDGSFDEAQKKFKEFIYKRPYKQFKKCLWYEKKCDGQIINAHSIQNSLILEKLSKDNHVIVLDYKMNVDIGPQATFKQKGRNEASTFTGLCRYHDNIIFEPIEKNALNLDNPEHLFLLSYRALLREFHSQLKAANHLQDITVKSKKLGLHQDWNQHILESIPIPFIAESYSTYRYKFIMDKVYEQKCYDEYFENIIISFPLQQISIAVNSAFSPINNMLNKNDRLDPKLIMLNIFPLEENYYVVISFRRDHSGIIKEFLNPILSANGIFQMYLISKLILQNCENFVIAPDYFSGFSEGKKKDVMDYFVKNLYTQKTDWENENLYLF